MNYDRAQDARDAIARLEQERQDLATTLLALKDARPAAAARADANRKHADRASRSLAAEMEGTSIGNTQGRLRNQYAIAQQANVSAQGDLDRIDREIRDIGKRREAIEDEIFAWRRHIEK